MEDDVDRYGEPDRSVLLAGRQILRRHVFAVISISALTILQYNLVIGPDRLPAQVVRFALTLLLCYGIYRGSPLAKWLAVCLFGIAGVLFFSLLLSPGHIGTLNWLTAAANCMTYLLFAWSLIRSTAVAAFLEFQRARARHMPSLE